jgi:hypothetical protein
MEPSRPPDLCNPVTAARGSVATLAVPTTRLHQLESSRAVVERSFWLYAWRIGHGSREFFKVERNREHDDS